MSEIKYTDELGRCCGRKPLQYKRGMLNRRYQFCDRCNAAFDLDGKQIENFAYRKDGEEFVLKNGASHPLTV